MKSVYQDKSINILIVDDEPDCCEALFDFVKMLPHTGSFKAYSGEEGLDILKNNRIDIIFSDVDMPGLSGIEFMNIIKEKKIDAELILISGKVDIINTIKAIDYGIYDFLAKPVDIYKVKDIIENINKMRIALKKISSSFIESLRSADDDELIDIRDLSCSSFYQPSAGSILLGSDSIKAVYKKLKKLHDYPDIPVLIEGLSGTGKEIAAKYIHFCGSMRNDQFIGVNCAAISKDIFEAELFGYENGAFTGAKKEGNAGYIKAAENGTLFLDEVSEIPVGLQAKLLRVVQEGEYYRVGSRVKDRVKCRFIFASNRNIDNLVKRKLFRKDLYYRINVCRIIVPPLRERIEEIVPMMIYFIEEQNKKLNKKISTVEAGFLKKAIDYPWPGNIRELYNFITGIILFCDKNTISTGLFTLMDSTQLSGRHKICLPVDDFTLPEKPFDLKKLNMAIIEKTLKKFNGNKSKTAKYLNLSRIQLYKRFKLHK